MKTSIDKLYFLMLQAFRNEMGLIDGRTWIENLDTLYKAERDQVKMELNTKFGVSSAGYNNDSIFKSVPDEKFWSQDDIWEYTEPEPEMLKNERYMVYRIKDISHSGTTVAFLFPDTVNVQEVREYLNKQPDAYRTYRIASVFKKENRITIKFVDSDAVTKFLEEYVLCDYDYSNELIRYLKLKRWPALEAD